METTAKKQDLESDVEKHSSKLDTACAKFTILDGKIAALEAELGVLSKGQLDMDMMRAEERKIFAWTKEDLEQGISGVQKALNALRSYSGSSFVQQSAAHEVNQCSSCTGTSIIGMIEVVQSDFSKNLAKNMKRLRIQSCKCACKGNAMHRFCSPRCEKEPELRRRRS